MNHGPPPPRGWLAVAALGYLLFVVYGSLVPLEFRALPLEEAMARFRAIPFLDLGIGSRADWVANLLLFIPLAFLWHALLWPGAGGRGRALTASLRLALSLLLLALALLLALGIEFTQLFFPQRTVSQNDVLAECLGALLGSLLWWWRGERLRAWFALWNQGRSPASLAERLMWLWLAGLFAYNLLPLDLTISPVEVFHKWREGRVVLLPFAALPAEPAKWLYEVLTDALIWVPVASLCVLSGRRTARGAWLWALGLAALLEGLQVFVWSRVTDVTDLITAALGAGLGTLAAVRWAGGRVGAAAPGAPATEGLPSTLWLGGFGALAWALVLVAVFWYPFDFSTEGAHLRSRLALLQQPPFHAYYFSTEFRAATSALQLVLWFAPIGVLLGLARSALPPGALRTLFGLACALALLGLPAGIELGQVALTTRKPDSTDWALASLGGLLGYGLALRHARWRRGGNPAPRRAAATPVAPARPGPAPAWATPTAPGGQSVPNSVPAGLGTPPAQASGHPGLAAVAGADDALGRAEPFATPQAARTAAVAGSRPASLRRDAPGRATPSGLRAGDLLALGLLAVLVLLPFRPEAGWVWSSPGGYLPELPRRLYELYKPLMLWVPLGAILALGGLSRWVAPLAAAVLTLTLAVGLAGAGPGGYRTLVETAGIALGLWAGAWLGRRLGFAPAPLASGLPRRARSRSASASRSGSGLRPWGRSRPSERPADA